MAENPCAHSELHAGAVQYKMYGDVKPQASMIIFPLQSGGLIRTEGLPGLNGLRTYGGGSRRVH